jgi:hypothetical protein
MPCSSVLSLFLHFTAVQPRTFFKFVANNNIDTHQQWTKTSLSIRKKVKLSFRLFTKSSIYLSYRAQIHGLFNNCVVVGDVKLLRVHGFLEGPGELVLPQGGEELPLHKLELVGVAPRPVRRRIGRRIHLPLRSTSNRVNTGKRELISEYWIN